MTINSTENLTDKYNKVMEILKIAFEKQGFFLKKRFFESLSGKNIVNCCIKNKCVCFWIERSTTK